MSVKLEWIIKDNEDGIWTPCVKCDKKESKMLYYQIAFILIELALRCKNGGFASCLYRTLMEQKISLTLMKMVREISVTTSWRLMRNVVTVYSLTVPLSKQGQNVLKEGWYVMQVPWIQLLFIGCLYIQIWASSPKI